MLKVEFITNRIFSSRTYILTKQKRDEVWLVDCGDVDRVLERIDGKTIEGVLLTHTHSDHIYGLEQLLERFPEVRIYTNVYGIKALGSPRLNISRYHDEYPDIAIDAPNNVHVLSQGDVISILDSSVSVYETPGHDPSCLTYAIGEYLFTGDAYIPEVKVFTGFPHSNKKQALESVERILQLPTSFRIMPGHTV